MVFKIHSKYDVVKCINTLKHRNLGTFIVAVEDGQYKIVIGRRRPITRRAHLLQHQPNEGII